MVTGGDREISYRSKTLSQGDMTIQTLFTWYTHSLSLSSLSTSVTITHCSHTPHNQNMTDWSFQNETLDRIVQWRFRRSDVKVWNTSVLLTHTPLTKMYHSFTTVKKTWLFFVRDTRMYSTTFWQTQNTTHFKDYWHAFLLSKVNWEISWISLCLFESNRGTVLSYISTTTGFNSTSGYI